MTGGEIGRVASGARRGEDLMAKAAQKVTLSPLQDIPFDKLVLSKDRSMGGGRRHCQRDQSSQIIAVHGIDLTPLQDRAKELTVASEAMRAERMAADRLRNEISRLRSVIRRILSGTDAAAEDQQTWASFPRRIAHLGYEALSELLNRVRRLLTRLGPSEISDRSEKNDQPYTTNQYPSESCNPAMPAENKRGQGAPTSPPQTPQCGLEHISLPMALNAAPPPNGMWVWSFMDAPIGSHL